VTDPDERDVDVSHARDDPIRVRVVELDAVDRRRDVDAIRLDTDLGHEVRIQEVLARHEAARRAVRAEGAQYALGVLGRATHPEVHVARRPRITVTRDGVAADDQVVNAGGVELGQHVAEVGIQHAAPGR
jgi:gamma-glutamyl:cysteine ligase YbdK (ATP-grasp superfamily)